MRTKDGATVHALVYEDDELIMKVTNKALIPDFEQSSIYEVREP